MHLFACSFYQMEKDIAKLADLLGHSNINTTRIYIISSGGEHRKQIERMNLLLMMVPHNTDYVVLLPTISLYPNFNIILL